MYPAYNVFPMYIGYETKCAFTPLMVMFVAVSTAAKFCAVMVPFDVVIAVWNVTACPLYVLPPVPP
ncbi:hypothetical protein D7I44_17760 [Gryllotalpicola protaetiae]|uniref:Uncharacterized protein n=2 Tax=Gryllotalpicola protaetiae TaxID=2419771 RepID=A0A387BMX6_9MICO|nr:hypothetical protein D7I44_17760 [Gryllotalpicola protaetiae]